MTNDTAPMDVSEEMLRKMARKMEQKGEPGVRVLTLKQWQEERAIAVME